MKWNTEPNATNEVASNGLLVVLDPIIVILCLIILFLGLTSYLINPLNSVCHANQ